MTQWLRLAAAPAFTVMALSMLVPDNGAPPAVCSTASSSVFGGMATMYLLMAVFHLPPWLKLVSRRGNVVKRDSFPASQSF
jgi:hypothetical protein